jgi:hypothetical protein
MKRLVVLSAHGVGDSYQHEKRQARAHRQVEGGVAEATRVDCRDEGALVYTREVAS